MRKSELSTQQLAQRATFLQRLGAAGWMGQALNAAFERGLWVDYEATMDYTNARARLSLLYSAEDESLELLLDEDWRYIVVIAFGAHFEQVLDLIIAEQDRLSAETLTALLQRLLDLGLAEVYLYSDERGRMPVDESILAELHQELVDG